MAKKKAIQSEELMKLFESSNRTYEEVVEFLKSWNGDQAGDKDHPELTESFLPGAVQGEGQMI